MPALRDVSPEPHQRPRQEHQIVRFHEVVRRHELEQPPVAAADQRPKAADHGGRVGQRAPHQVHQRRRRLAVRVHEAQQVACRAQRHHGRVNGQVPNGSRQGSSRCPTHFMTRSVGQCDCCVDNDVQYGSGSEIQGAAPACGRRGAGIHLNGAPPHGLYDFRTASCRSIDGAAPAAIYDRSVPSLSDNNRGCA